MPVSGSADCQDRPLAGEAVTACNPQAVRLLNSSRFGLAAEIAIVVLGHIGRGVLDEADQGLGGLPAGGIINVCQHPLRDHDFHFGVLVEMDGFLSLKTPFW